MFFYRIDNIDQDQVIYLEIVEKWVGVAEWSSHQAGNLQGGRSSLGTSRQPLTPGCLKQQNVPSLIVYLYNYRPVESTSVKILHRK